MNHDVIVVGGGPGGSTTATLLAKGGLDVALVDKQEFPRHKLCGGLLSWKTVKLLRRVFNETPANLKKQGILNHESEQYEVFYRDQFLCKHRTPYPFYFVERSVYDNHLLELAQKEGVDVATGEAVTSLDEDLKGLRTSNGRHLRAPYIIGADSANSFIRTQLIHSGRLNGVDWTTDLASAVEIYVPRKEAEYSPPHPVLHFGPVDWGYAWVFPNKEKLLVGLGGLNRKNSKFGEILERYFDRLGIDRSAGGQLYGHPIPYGNFLKNPGVDNVLLVGDAAGLADPVFGEGVFYAQRSGELAAAAIQRAIQSGEPPYSQYRALLEEHVWPEFIYGKRSRRFLFAGPDSLNKTLIRIAFKLFSKQLGELVHGDRSFKFLREYEGLHERV